MSGDQIAFLDPHESYFQHREGNRPARATSSYAFTLGCAALQQIPHQFEPFKQRLFGCESLDILCYTGTVFRFPLRRDGSRSMLSHSVYGDEKMSQMLTMLQSEAHALLLFLNSVESIEWYEKSSLHDEPRLMFAVKVDANIAPVVRLNRAAFMDKIRPHIKRGEWKNEPESTTFEVVISAMQTLHGQRTESQKAWLLTQHYHGGNSASKLKQIIMKGHSKLLPWVGIALPLHEGQVEDPQGQLFCFLPLPVTEGSATGFHFHVNGYFAVSQNR